MAAEGAERVVHVRSLQSIGGRVRVHHPPAGQKMGPAAIVAAGPLGARWMGAYGMSTFERSVPL